MACGLADDTAYRGLKELGCRAMSAHRKSGLAAAHEAIKAITRDRLSSVASDGLPLKT